MRRLRLPVDHTGLFPISGASPPFAGARRPLPQANVPWPHTFREKRSTRGRRKEHRPRRTARPEAREEAPLDSTALRRIVGIDLGRERVPDGTTLLMFRRLLKKRQLGQQLFAAVGQVMQARGLMVGTGTIMGATIIGAPSSTKNADRRARVYQPARAQER